MGRGVKSLILADKPKYSQLFVLGETVVIRKVKVTTNLKKLVT